MKCRVELVYDLDCPNIGAARTALLQAFARAGVAASWKEWDRKAPESPAYVRRYGSPTILVNGQDVVSAEPTDGGDCCRLYNDGENEFRGVPLVDQIVTVLTKGAHAAASAANETGRRWRWGSLLPVMPGSGAALLPIGTCPVCWPAYAGFLTSVGLGFLLSKNFLVPMSIALWGLALASLAYRARARRGYGPLSVGVVAVSIVLVGKFVLSSHFLLYLGLIVLMGASLWNSWPHGAAASGSCVRCASREPEGEQ